MFDPYLSDSLTEKYAATDMPHIRMTRRCVEPGMLGFVDVVAASHAHTDHLDGETLCAVARAAKTAGRTPMPLVVPAAVRDIAEERLAGEPWVFHGLDAGLKITPCRGSSSVKMKLGRGGTGEE